LTVGYYFGRASQQSANDLIEAGFTIVDPEGYAVRDFDDGPANAVNYYFAALTQGNQQ